MVARTLIPMRATTTRVRTDGELRPASLVTEVDDPEKSQDTPPADSDPAPTPSSGAGAVKRIGNDTLPFCEDVLVFPGANVAIFSSDPDRDVYNPFANEGDPTKAQNGRLMAYPLSCSRGKEGAYEIQVKNWPTDRALHPLGIGLSRDPDHPILAVANVTASFSAVEVLRLTVDDGVVGAEFCHSLAHPQLHTPNAVVALNADCVLVTNSFAYSAQTNKTLNALETFLAIPGGNILILIKSDSEDADCRVVGSGIALANGLALSDDGSVLAAVGCVTANIHVYDLSPPLQAAPSDFAIALATCTYRETIPAGFMVDNLRFVSTSKDEHLFLACGHPSGLDFAACAKTRGKGPLSGTRVVSVRIPTAVPVVERIGAWWNALFTRIDGRVKTVFEDSGEVLGTGSTACVVPAQGEGEKKSEEEGEGVGKADLLVTGLFDRRGPVRISGVEL